MLHGVAAVAINGDQQQWDSALETTVRGKLMGEGCRLRWRRLVRITTDCALALNSPPPGLVHCDL